MDKPHLLYRHPGLFRWALTCDAQIEAIRAQAKGGQKVLPEREVLVLDEAGDLVARVHKTLYVRQKKTVVATNPPTH